MNPHSRNLVSTLAQIIFKFWHILRRFFLRLSQKLSKAVGRKKPATLLTLLRAESDSTTFTIKSGQFCASETPPSTAVQSPTPVPPVQSSDINQDMRYIPLAKSDATTHVPDTSPSVSSEGNVTTVAVTELKAQSNKIGPLFYAIAPSEFERYERSDTVPVRSLRWRESERMDEAFTPRRGAIFSLETRNLFNKVIMSQVEKFLEQVVEFVLQHQQEFSIHFDARTVDLVLDITYVNDSDLVCGYYFAHHQNRMIFWAEDFPASRRLWSDMKGVTSKLHILHAMQAQYWLVSDKFLVISKLTEDREHCSLFPCSRPLSQEIIEQVRDILIHAIAAICIFNLRIKPILSYSLDSLISKTAIHPYSTQQMESMLAIIPTILPSETDCGGLSRTVYRILKIFTKEQFFHFHGEPTARLDFGRSVYNRAASSTAPYWFHFLAAVCLCAPYQHLDQIKGMFSDSLLSYPRWTQFTQKMVEEWTDLTLYSTVMLNANIAFLSVQSIDSIPSQSPIKVAIYISGITSLGSITVGLLLLRRTRSKELEKNASYKFVSRLSVKDPDI
ncbi:hypothetical protein GYMLUDRAFT_57568 [Collybiopsis luxurians FD-317 M1]|uniref:Uncharacterized protein n=1 Tax=Collybiopsis luxurians FD-317 M1 TaxID=944289 RepID=A0A0D0D292_9AGAR|nr:hypothetical protein GYMLUDRAFT_57568 [Collybiopsis luxurians FD-317 M1]